MQSTQKLHKITDELYGTYEIENILYELLNSDALLRLKQIHQGGGTFLVNNKWNTTRYEHSVGVMLLIKILGGSLEDQILGLLHDVSHTAFSHVIDYIVDEKSEDFHEKIFEDVIENSQIPYILNKYDIDYKSLLLKECSILDTPLPELCADRIDYTLRDMYKCEFINKEEVEKFSKKLNCY